MLPEDGDTPSVQHKVQEDLGRFRIWAGNYGAHRKQTDRLSLDHRLREAPEMHQEVTSHLNDLSGSIQSGRFYMVLFYPFFLMKPSFFQLEN